MVQNVVRLDFKETPKGKISRYQFEIAADGLGNPIYIPVIVAHGINPGPIFGITAVIHGNEINGIPVIQRVMREINLQKLNGIVVGVPVVNVPGFLRETRNFNDGVDLNHVVPGNKRGNSSSIYVHRFFERIVSQFEYLVDLHTASYGRINSFYVRADMENKIARKMAYLINPEIILHNKSAVGTLRHAAIKKGIPAITIELRDPYKFQKKIIKDGANGIRNILDFIEITQDKKIISSNLTTCCRSYWIYTNQGGLLSVIPSLLAHVEKGEIIARVRNIFGDIIEEYFAPENGIVIGKSINPVNQTGSRIIHLGIIDK